MTGRVPVFQCGIQYEALVLIVVRVLGRRQLVWQS